MKINIATTISFVCLLISIKTQKKIGFGWNSYVTSLGTEDVSVEENGVKNWVEHVAIISIYFYVNKPGKLNLKLESANN